MRERGATAFCLAFFPLSRHHESLCGVRRGITRDSLAYGDIIARDLFK